MIIAIIQARLGSTRLPGKILKELLTGKTAIECMLERVRRSKYLEQIIVATTTNPNDKELIDHLKGIEGIKYFAGSEEDVLDRHYYAAKKFKADIVVRLTSDCPVIDPEIIDKVIRYYLDNDFDYVANTLEPTNFPDGMDVEVFSFKNLEKAWKEAKLPSHREHVTFYFWQNPNVFKVGKFPLEQNWAHYRLTLDYPEDLGLLTRIYSDLYGQKEAFRLEDIIRYLEENPEIAKINMEIERNQSWQKAFEKDRELAK